MTRINVVPVEELSDQHLIAEYRELPRVIKQDFNIKDAPYKYCLGKGHVKWAKKHSLFVMKRYNDICDELFWRGLKGNYTFLGLYSIWLKNCGPLEDNWYNVSKEDLNLNRQRLIEKYNLKPEFYRWTKRNKPNYYKDS